jgi:hypothetical protein
VPLVFTAESVAAVVSAVEPSSAAGAFTPGVLVVGAFVVAALVEGPFEPPVLEVAALVAAAFDVEAFDVEAFDVDVLDVAVFDVAVFDAVDFAEAAFVEAGFFAGVFLPVEGAGASVPEADPSVEESPVGFVRFAAVASDAVEEGSTCSVRSSGEAVTVLRYQRRLSAAGPRRDTVGNSRQDTGTPLSSLDVRCGDGHEMATGASGPSASQTPSLA